MRSASWCEIKLSSMLLCPYLSRILTLGPTKNPPKLGTPPQKSNSYIFYACAQVGRLPKLSATTRRSRFCLFNGCGPFPTCLEAELDVSWGQHLVIFHLCLVLKSPQARHTFRKVKIVYFLHIRLNLGCFSLECTSKKVISLSFGPMHLPRSKT